MRGFGRAMRADAWAGEASRQRGGERLWRHTARVTRTNHSGFFWQVGFPDWVRESGVGDGALNLHRSHRNPETGAYTLS